MTIIIEYVPFTQEDKASYADRFPEYVRIKKPEGTLSGKRVLNTNGDEFTVTRVVATPPEGTVLVRLKRIKPDGYAEIESMQCKHLDTGVVLRHIGEFTTVERMYKDLDMAPLSKRLLAAKLRNLTYKGYLRAAPEIKLPTLDRLVYVLTDKGTARKESLYWEAP